MTMKYSLIVNILIASLCLDVSSPVSPVYPSKASNFQAYFPAPSKARHYRPQVPTRAPKFKTETVYGFLDFTTTIGSTVMVFTPQEEKKPAPAKNNIKPSSTLTKLATTQAPKDPILNQRIPTTKQRHRNQENLTPVASKASNNDAKISKDLTTTKSSPTGLAALLRKALTDKDNKGDRKISFSSRPFRNSYKNGRPPTDKKREDLNVRPKKKYTNGGGSTIIPITVEGTGGSLPTKIIEATPLRVTTVPKEVVVSAQQNFRPIKAIGPFSTEVNNAIESDYHHYDHLLSQPSPTVTESYSIFHRNQELHSPITETKIVYTASAIGANSIDNSILKSSNFPFPRPQVHTLSAVIEGSSTEFFRPEATAILPLESLFDQKPNRDGRNNGLHYSRATLSKRRGPGTFVREEPSYYQTDDDQFYDESYDYDLQRAGSESKLTYNGQNPPISPTPASDYYEKPNIYRSRFRTPGIRTTGTRNSPPPLPRRKRPKQRLGAVSKFNGQRPRLTNRPQSPPLQRTKKKVAKNNAPLEPFGINDEERINFNDGNVVNLNPSQDSQPQASSFVPKAKEPLFENILDAPKGIATLPPIDINGNALDAILRTLTESYHTTETIYKTSVLPVKDIIGMNYHTLTQTYRITRIVNAIKTMPPVEAFEFVPGTSLNEFNDRLLAEGTEHEDALLLSEQEYHENSESRINDAADLLEDPNLADLAGGKFNPDVLEKQMHPELSAALTGKKVAQNNTPNKIETQPALATPSNIPTPNLSPEQLQMAYLRIINPYLFAGLPGMPGATPLVSSTSRVVTTEITTTISRTFPIQFNDRKIVTTLTSVSVMRTTTTVFDTVTASPSMPGFPGGLGFPYPQGLPFPTG